MTKRRQADLKGILQPYHKALMVACSLVEAAYQASRILNEGKREKLLYNAGLIYLVHINYAKLFEDDVFVDTGVSEWIKKLIKSLPLKYKKISGEMLKERNVPLSHISRKEDLSHFEVKTAHIHEDGLGHFSVKYYSLTDLTGKDMKDYKFELMMELTKIVALELDNEITNSLAKLGCEKLKVSLQPKICDWTKEIEPREGCSLPMVKNPSK